MSSQETLFSGSGFWDLQWMKKLLTIGSTSKPLSRLLELVQKVPRGQDTLRRRENRIFKAWKAAYFPNRFNHYRYSAYRACFHIHIPLHSNHHHLTNPNILVYEGQAPARIWFS